MLKKISIIILYSVAIIILGIYGIVEMMPRFILSGSCDIDDLILNVLGAVIMFEILNAKRVRELINRVFLELQYN